MRQRGPSYPDSLVLGGWGHVATLVGCEQVFFSVHLFLQNTCRLAYLEDLQLSVSGPWATHTQVAWTHTLKLLRTLYLKSPRDLQNLKKTYAFHSFIRGGAEKINHLHPCHINLETGRQEWVCRHFLLPITTLQGQIKFPGNHVEFVHRGPELWRLSSLQTYMKEYSQNTPWKQEERATAGRCDFRAPFNFKSILSSRDWPILGSQ